MFSKISLNKLPQINFINSSRRIPNNNLERIPSRDCVSFGALKPKETEISPEVKDMLDNNVFTFKKDNGEIFEGTIREYFENSIIRKNDTWEMSLIHCTTTKEVAESIIRDGLDWTKTGRMKCGPGTYFSPSAACGTEQGAGSIPIEGIYMGNKKKYPVFEQNFYMAVDGNSQITDAVSSMQDGNARDIINKYCHDLLLNEMGFDFLYAGSGRGVGSYVILNDKCMELSKYNW